MDIVKSVVRYENWLEKALQGDVNRDDIGEKHKKMAAGSFQFLRGTYWRWAETINEPKVCPELGRAPQVLCVGDIHVENFGTWRDADGRLIWGVNDFDEAAVMPYLHDIVRLATSAVLADVPGITMQTICKRILEGYQAGIARPIPYILDRRHKKLRQVAIVSESDRKDFWTKFDPELIRLEMEKEEAKAPEKRKRSKVRPVTSMLPQFRKALDAAKPNASIKFEYYERTAGTGSLGRRRYFGVGEWLGDLVIREAKAIVPSGWHYARNTKGTLSCELIATGKFRAPDPFYRLEGDVLLRRLSPNDFKIETEPRDKKAKADKERESHRLVKRSAVINDEALHAMGRDIAAIHRATDTKNRIVDDFPTHKTTWLLDAVRRAQAKVEGDWRKWYEHFHAGASAEPKKTRRSAKAKKKPAKKADPTDQ
jgi:uncharacterized protein (DUF2252 family)